MLPPCFWALAAAGKQGDAKCRQQGKFAQALRERIAAFM